MDNIERVIILSQSEALILLPLLKNSIDKLYNKALFPFANLEILEQLRLEYKSIADKVEEAFNV